MISLLLMAALGASPSPPAFTGLWHCDQDNKTTTIGLSPSGQYEMVFAFALHGYRAFAMESGTWRIEKDGSLTLIEGTGKSRTSYRMTVQAGGRELTLKSTFLWFPDPEATRLAAAGAANAPTLIYKKMSDLVD
ncbi:MAG: hypothetical protein HY928_14355 [Elusimicrobia bacterium]|nr:hypothetical protein [Elusimicrobiota bacterium]